MSSTDEHLEPLGLSVDQAARRAGLGRTHVYELAAAGAFRSVRVGRRILIDAKSFEEWFASLPAHES